MSSKKHPVDASKAYAAIIDSIERIKSFTRDFSIDQFIRDRKTISAVCFEFVTLGERIYDLNKENYFAKSPYSDRILWDKVANLRHFLSHGYYGDIDTAVLWQTIQNNLGVLEKAIRWHMENK